MIKVEKVEIWGFDHAIRGMRNPMNSWDKSDSFECFDKGLEVCNKCPLTDDQCSISDGVFVGDKDIVLMQRLYKAGTEHRKYLRQIFVSMDITAPLYWWKEFDTYKIGTTANSCSTMHKIHAKEFELDDFSHEHLNDDVIKKPFKDILDCLNFFRELYIQHNDKEDWWQMIQLLPSSYNQKRTVTMNYENVMSIINQRSNHKLDEWRILIDEFKKLPYVEEIRDGA